MTLPFRCVLLGLVLCCHTSSWAQTSVPESVPPQEDAAEQTPDTESTEKQEEAAKEAARREEERAREAASQREKEFKPSEEISEDLPAPFPVDI